MSSLALSVPFAVLQQAPYWAWARVNKVDCAVPRQETIRLVQEHYGAVEGEPAATEGMSSRQRGQTKRLVQEHCRAAKGEPATAEDSAAAASMPPQPIELPSA